MSISVGTDRLESVVAFDQQQTPAAWHISMRRASSPVRLAIVGRAHPHLHKNARSIAHQAQTVRPGGQQTEIFNGLCVERDADFELNFQIGRKVDEYLSHLINVLRNELYVWHTNTSSVRKRHASSWSSMAQGGGKRR
jgi:hypothetical protein